MDTDRMTPVDCLWVTAAYIRDTAGTGIRSTPRPAAPPLSGFADTGHAGARDSRGVFTAG